MKVTQILNEGEQRFEIVDVQVPGTANGTSFQGNLYKTSYQDLVAWFGEPDRDNGEPDKVTVSWSIDIQYRDNYSMDPESVETARVEIYDWKQSGPIEQVTTWNVGARNLKETWVLDAVIEQKKQMPAVR